MDDVALRSLTQWFRSYVDRFRRDSDTLHPMMELKFAHTARVALLGRTIAELSGWTACEANLAEAAGWLHDVGRFSQWADFATYRDRISVDHASRGCEVLGREDVLSVASAQDRDYLMEAVALHNRLTLPDTLSPASRALCALVRDADKLDIFDLVCAHLDDGTLADLVPLLSAVPQVSPAIIEEVRTSHLASYCNVHTIADYVLVSIAWAWDLNYGATAEMAHRKQVLQRLAVFLPDTPEVRAVVCDAMEHLQTVAVARTTI